MHKDISTSRLWRGENQYRRTKIAHKNAKNSNSSTFSFLNEFSIRKNFKSLHFYSFVSLNSVISNLTMFSEKYDSYMTTTGNYKYKIFNSGFNLSFSYQHSNFYRSNRFYHFDNFVFAMKSINHDIEKKSNIDQNKNQKFKDDESFQFDHDNILQNEKHYHINEHIFDYTNKNMKKTSVFQQVSISRNGVQKFPRYDRRPNRISDERPTETFRNFISTIRIVFFSKIFDDHLSQQA